jgi:hypothetical protein
MSSDLYQWKSEKRLSFLKLTLLDDLRLWISVTKITAICDGLEGGALIYVDGDSPWYVKESPQEIMEALSK